MKRLKKKKQFQKKKVPVEEEIEKEEKIVEFSISSRSYLDFVEKHKEKISEEPDEKIRGEKIDFTGLEEARKKEKKREKEILEPIDWDEEIEEDEKTFLLQISANADIKFSKSYEAEKTDTQVNGEKGERVSIILPKIEKVKICGEDYSSDRKIAVNDLDNGYITISGTVRKGTYSISKVLLGINGEESTARGKEEWEYKFKPQIDVSPQISIEDILINNFEAEDIEDTLYLDVSNLQNNNIIVSGKAESEMQEIRYEIVVKGFDEKGNESKPLTLNFTFQYGILKKVEVSSNDGANWNDAQGIDSWTYSFKPIDKSTYFITARAFDDVGNTFQIPESYEVYYSNLTKEQLLRQDFERLMNAYESKSKSAFFQYISEEFHSNYEDIRDYNELEDTIDEKFLYSNTNVDYKIDDVIASGESGKVLFSWYYPTVQKNFTFQAEFRFKFFDKNWKLEEVIDEDTFLKLSKEPATISLKSDKYELVSNDKDTAIITAYIYDKNGRQIGSGVIVNFSADIGLLEPSTVYTEGGSASTTYKSGVESGEAKIVASCGDVETSIIIKLKPESPPPFPQE